MIVIVKNNTENDITINNLSGIIIPESGQLDLMSLFKFHEIAGCDELKILVNNEDLIINDGTNDLSVSDGLKYLEIKSTKEIITEVISEIKYITQINFYSISANVKNQYVYLGGNPSNKTGYLVTKNGKIKSIAYMNFYGNYSQQSGYISIRKNETYTEIAQMIITEDAQKEYTNTPTGSLSFSAGDWLSCYVSGGRLTKPIIIIEIEWD